MEIDNDTKKQENEQKALELALQNSKAQDLICFQNLVPGQQESPFIERFIDVCLGDEEADERKQLLDEIPPVLSFSNEGQKKSFYDDEAKNCQQFCCRGVSVESELGDSDKTVLKSIDNYMYSIGLDKVYEGSADNIKEQMQEEVGQEAFGGTKQKQIVDGLKQFESVVEKRGEAQALSKSPEKTEETSRAPKPTK